MLAATLNEGLRDGNACDVVTPQVHGVAKSCNGDSLLRDFRVRQLLQPKIGAIGVEDVQAVLCDEFGAPGAICRSPHEYAGQGSSMTIASTVFDLKNEVIHVAAGQPTRSTCQPVYLPGAGERKTVQMV